MRTASLRAWVGLWALVIATMASACVAPREPSYDPTIGQELTTLSRETAEIFQALAMPSGNAPATRAPLYARALARAQSIALLSSARGQWSARRAGAEVLALGLTEKQRERFSDYDDATAGYMSDFIRNMRVLEADDLAAQDRHGLHLAQFDQAFLAHEAALDAYRIALGRWRVGQGPRPALPEAAPKPPDIGLDPGRVARRWVQIQDILRDALVYERDILDRSR